MGIVRIHMFVVKSMDSKATSSIVSAVITDTLFAASGFFNVLVYTLTRPALLQPRPAPDAKPAYDTIFREAQDRDLATAPEYT